MLESSSNPEEPGQMETDDQLRTGVQEPVAEVGSTRPREERAAVGERVVQVTRDQNGFERVGGACDHPDDFDHRHLLAAELPQEPILAPCELVGKLLQRVDRAVVVDETNDVPADAAHDPYEPVGFPLLERLLPGQVEEIRMPGARLQLEGVASFTYSSESDCSGVIRECQRPRSGRL